MSETFHFKKEKSNVSWRRIGVKWFHFQNSDDVPVDLFLPPLVALLFLLLLVTYKNWLCILSSSKLLLFFFFFSNAVGDATSRLSRQTNAAGSAVGHSFSRRKTTRVTAHTLIYVSQCEMRHSNPVPQHFFGTLSRSSLFVRHSCFACLIPLSIALFDVELRFFVACFLDLFLSPFHCFTCL